MPVFQEQEINDLTLKATPADTDEIEIQETGGGLSKKTTLATLEKVANKNQPSGYEGLDVNSELPHLPAGAASAAAGAVLQKDGTWVLRQVQHAAGAAIASAATVDLTAATGDLVHITGTTPITAWTINSNQRVKCIADAALPLTYSATTNALNSGGIDITLSAGDRFDVYTDGTTVRLDIILLNGKAVTASGADTSLSNLTVTGQDKIATAWVNFNGTGTVAIRDQFNVSSITDNGIGDYTINFTVTMANANYAISGITELNSSGQVLGIKNATTPTTSLFEVATQAPGVGVADSTYVNLIVFGGL